MGSRTEIVRWQESTVEAARLVRTREGLVELGDFYLGINHSQLIFSSIGPQQKDVSSFIIPVGEPGIYSIRAEIFGSPIETAAAVAEAELAGVKADRVVWGSDIYFAVGDELPGTSQFSQSASAAGVPTK